MSTTINVASDDSGALPNSKVMESRGSLCATSLDAVSKCDVSLPPPPPWPVESAEGKRLCASMSAPGQAALLRWRGSAEKSGTWEAQTKGYFCAPASAVSALRFLGLAGRGLSQDAVFNQIVTPNGLFTAGISFEHGCKMLKLLGGDLLDVQACSSRQDTEMTAWLRKDLTSAFEHGENLCILVNYWRPISGGGHWSPLGGFAEEKVLILDTAANKNPHQWMPLEWLVHGLCRHNGYTGLPRGYVIIRERHHAE